MRIIIIALFLCVNFALANTNMLREDAINMLKNFNPASSIPNFNPKEININDTKSRVISDDTARFILKEEKERIKSPQNFDEDKLGDLTNNINIKDIKCASGECDNSQNDISSDINEGIGRLGVISETAQEITSLQAQSGNPVIFKGYYQECEKYMLGTRDCCTDSGSLSGIINCPQELQSLQQAKHENRAVYLGHYKPRRFSTTRYGYCVFPTKLAAIVQVEGRQNQLRVGFGSAKHPDCRGITVEEVQRINFSALNIEPLVNDLINKKDLPNSSEIEALNKAKVNSMHNKGQAYD